MVDTNSILAKLKTLESVDPSIRDHVHGAQDHKYCMDPNRSVGGHRLMGNKTRHFPSDRLPRVPVTNRQWPVWAGVRAQPLSPSKRIGW